MTPQEQQMIQSLADRINNTPLAEKDPDAEGFLQQSLGRNPDALYILAQTTLVQQYALEQAQKQLADLRTQLDQQRQQAEQPRHATSFLGNLLGHHDDPAPQNPPAYRPSPVSYAPGAGSSFSRPTPPPPPPSYGQPYYEQPQYGPPPPQYGAPQSGGFLRSAMQTAAGVAAGALAFEGIESLMHGFGGGGGYSSGMGGGRPEEVINNYYGDSSPAEHKEHLSSDIEDRRDQSGFSDAVDRDDHNYKEGLSGNDTDTDNTGTDNDTDNTDTDTADLSDTSTDDSSFDDNSGGDDFSSSFGDDSN